MSEYEETLNKAEKLIIAEKYDEARAVLEEFTAKEHQFDSEFSDLARRMITFQQVLFETIKLAKIKHKDSLVHLRYAKKQLEFINLLLGNFMAQERKVEGRIE